MEFTFKYSSPERALMRREALQLEINQYDEKIRAIQNQRSEALEECAALENMLVQNGHSQIHIGQSGDVTPLLPYAQANTAHAPVTVADEPPAGNKKSVSVTKTKNKGTAEENKEYDKSWNLRVKLKWLLTKTGPLQSKEIKERLKKLEPKIKSLQNCGTILGDARDFTMTTPIGGGKPLYDVVRNK